MSAAGLTLNGHLEEGGPGASGRKKKKESQSQGDRVLRYRNFSGGLRGVREVRGTSDGRRDLGSCGSKGANCRGR